MNQFLISLIPMSKLNNNIKLLLLTRKRSDRIWYRIYIYMVYGIIYMIGNKSIIWIYIYITINHQMNNYDEKYK